MCQTGFVVGLALLFPMVGWAGDSVGFQTAVGYPVGHNPQGVAVADFNGDGNQDVVVAYAGDATAGDDGGISILLGNGDGTLQTATNIAVGKNPIFVAVGDLNGDSKIDLLVLSPGDMTASPPLSGTISVLLGNGNGTFQPGLTYTLMGQLYSLAVADFDGNNHLDFVLLWNPFGGQETLTMWPGNGDGTFQQGSDLTTSAPVASNFPFDIGLQLPLVADFNGDHIPDLVELVSPDFLTTGDVNVLLGNGDGTFQAPLTSPGDPYGMFVLGDLNGDGRSDLVIEGYLPMLHITRAYTSLGNGDGTFSGGASVDTTLLWSLSAVGDLNGDGKLDLVGLQNGPGIVVGLGNGDGSFQPVLPFAEKADITFTEEGLVLADLNNDKAPDIVNSNYNSTITVLLNQALPNFTIAAAPPTPAAVTAGQSATSIVTISMLPGYRSPVFLSCSVQPAQSNQVTCSINPGPVNIDPGQSTTATLTIQTTGGAQAALRASLSETQPNAWLLLAFALTGCARLVKRDRKKTNSVVALGGLLMTSLSLQLACGGQRGGSAPGPRTYIISVTASSAWNSGPSGLEKLAEVTLTVQ